MVAGLRGDPQAAGIGGSLKAPSCDPSSTLSNNPKKGKTPEPLIGWETTNKAFVVAGTRKKKEGTGVITSSSLVGWPFSREGNASDKNWFPNGRE